MKNILKITALVVFAGPAFAQEQGQAPVTLVVPKNLSELGTSVIDKTTDMVKDSVADLNLEAPAAEVTDPSVTEEEAAGAYANEPDELREIREILRNLETQRSVTLRIAEIQKQLIGFAGKDPNAAKLSRPPFKVCELILEDNYCMTLAASFALKPEDVAMQ